MRLFPSSYPDMIKLTLFVTVAIKLTTSNAQEDLIVEVTGGKVLGHVLKSWNNSDYYAYQEIPYAAPPTGVNSYKLPQDVEPWEGVLNATLNTKVCPQFEMATNKILKESNIEITEDCLYLNVYTPVKPGTENLQPVMVYFHGGANVLGSAIFTNNGPKYIMDHEVVVVTFNWRIGPLGFLSTMDGVIQGNLGLKDQGKALDWIRDNIKAFGGDPDKVTLVGQGTGAFSVGYHLLSKSSEGKFVGAIQQSGSALCRGSFTFNARHYAFELGRLIDDSFVSNRSEDLLKLLQNAELSQVIEAANQVLSIEDPSSGYIPDIIWSAVIEDPKTENAFITAPQLGTVLAGSWNRVPLMLGFTSEESLFFLNSSSNLDYEYDSNSSLLISSKLDIFPEWHSMLGIQLKEIYTSNNFSEDFGALLKFSSDSGVTNGILKQAEVSSEQVSVYLYQFNYEGRLGLGVYPDGIRPDIEGAGGVGHSEDLAYLWEFGSYKNNDLIDENDELTIKRMVKLWTNFVKYQNPTPDVDEILSNVQWTKVTGEVLQYLDINNNLELKSTPRYYDEVNELLWRYINAPYYVF